MAMPNLDIEDKLKLLTGQGFSFTNECLPGADRFVPGAAGYTYAIEAIGLSSLVLADGPAGLRLAPENAQTGEPQYATAFPIATLIASSWDTDLATEIGAAMGEEAVAFGVDFLLAPGMNLHRNPLGGRNFEYYSEDPILSGQMAGAAVRGIQSQGVGATIKHFVANNQETNRFVIDTLVDQRSLRELYLRAFEIAIETGKPWAVMSAYNKLNGTHTSQNRELLVDILRDDFGFDGVVMSDWYSGDDVVAQIAAGNNLIMPGTKKHDAALKEAFEAGGLTEEIIDENLHWIFKAIDQVKAANKPAPTNTPPLEANAKIARRAAAEASVLLKNDDQVLPLGDDIQNIALFGVGAFSTVSGGTGSGDVNEAYVIHVADGLTERGWSLDETLVGRYVDFIADFEANKPKPETVLEEFLLNTRPEEMAIDAGVLNAAVRSNQIAVITISRNAGEFADREVEGDFDLTPAERDLLSNVSKAFRGADKPVVVILNIGNVIEVASWQDLADAILLPWQGGQEAGRAIADVLSGDINPSGRLPMTFPLSYADTPSSPNFPGTESHNKPIEIMAGMMTQYESEVVYQEGLYVGYRHFTSREKPVAYPLGYGLSYTRFEYGGLEVASAADGGVDIELFVTNIGAVSGREVVQIYVEAPEGKLIKPRRELKAFGKTKPLAPGETERLTLSISLKDLSSFDAEASQWIVEAGDYRILACRSASEIEMSETMDFDETIIVETVSNVLGPPAGRFKSEVSS